MFLPLIQLPAAPGGGNTLRPSASLEPGQMLRAVVSGEPGALYLRLAGQRVPLARETALTPGQAMLAEVVAQEDGLALRLHPLPSPSPPPPFSDALRAILSALGQLSQADDAASITPAGLAAHEAGLRQVLLLLFEKDGLGDDLQLLARFAARAAAAGIIPEAGAAFAALSAQDAPALKQLLEQFAAGRSAEARLAAALAEGNLDETIAVLRAGLREQVARLRGHDALRAWLRGQGAIRQFEAAAGRVLDRLDAGTLQNLRGLDQPYVFIELPVLPETGCRRARIHFFGEGRGKAFRRAGTATVALDLSLERLGDLWVTLETRAGRCACRFRARESHALTAVRENAEELKAALENAGYAGVRVDVQEWDGDRLRAAAGLARACAGLDIST